MWAWLQQQQQQQRQQQQQQQQQHHHYQGALKIDDSVAGLAGSHIPSSVIFTPTSLAKVGSSGPSPSSHFWFPHIGAAFGADEGTMLVSVRLADDNPKCVHPTCVECSKISPCKSGANLLWSLHPHKHTVRIENYDLLACVTTRVIGWEQVTPRQRCILKTPGAAGGKQAQRRCRMTSRA